jgi:hypothetical protein
LSLSAGCGPTYPKEKLAGSIVELCEKEYGVKVKSRIVGKTLAIFIPLPSLLDITLRINKRASDMIQDVILSASRVVLSTDAEIEFYCVIAQDIRFPELQIIVVKYVDDVKRAFFSDISRGEYFKRTLFDINLNPQSKKEKSIKTIFKKYNLDPELEEKVLDEFFRSQPIVLKDFGYWQNHFYIKDVTLPEFLAEQLSYRIRMRFREDEDLSNKFLIKEINSSYKKSFDTTNFNIYFDIRLNEILKTLGEGSNKKVVFRNIFVEISDCLYGYKFQDFDSVKIFDKNSISRLFVSKEDIFAFKRKRLGIDSILAGI